MKNKNDLIIILVVILIVGLFLGKKWANRVQQKPNRIVGQLSPSPSPGAQVGIANVVSAQTPSVQPTPSAVVDPKKAESENLANVDIAEYYKKQNAGKVSQVFKQSGLLVKLPEDMSFDSIEVDVPQSVAVFGKNNDQTEGITYIAAKKMPSVDEVTGLLKNSPDEVPNLTNRNVKWDDSVESFKLSKESGIKDGYLWRGKDANGQAYAAVMLTREDGQGSYMFIKDSPAASMVDNDDYYEQFKGSVKALPLAE